MHIYIKAPAKINLHLDIGDKRSDGYHNILSIFQMVSLYDIICIRFLKEENVFQLHGNLFCSLEDNTISKAVESFRKKTGINQGVSITVHKEIPIGSGLGGGSADAAAVLLGLNQLFHAELNQAALNEMAINIGSDVPFFLNTPAALVSGKGEVVTPLQPRTDYYAVLAYPGFPIQSKIAYQLWDKSEPTISKAFHLSDYREELGNQYQQNTINNWNFNNSFYSVLMKEYLILNQMVKIFHDTGSIFVNVSGSGSTIFGLYENCQQAKAASFTLKINKWFVRVVKPLAINIQPIIKCF